MTKEEQELLTMIRNCKDPARALDAALEIILHCLSAGQRRESYPKQDLSDHLESA